MTVKLTVVYGTPADAAEFDRHYTDVHLPIVDRWPNVQRRELARVSGGPPGAPSPYHLIAEFWFADEAALGEALRSPAGGEAAKDFQAIAPEGSFMTVSTVVE